MDKTGLDQLLERPLKIWNWMPDCANLPIAGLAFMLSVFASGTVHAESAEPAFSVLVFSKTVGFRHDSIPAGIAAIQAFGEQNNFHVDATEDAGLFADENLVRYRAVIFLSTTGDVLDPRQQVAFENFIRRGGGFVGIHAASDTEYDWPWYGGLVGTYFRKHPAIQSATLNVVDPSHASTRHLPIKWTRTDEWYNFTHDLDPDVTVLIRIEERSYRGGTMGANHPMSWHHLYDGGRAWYTAIGHTIESYREPLFLQHLLGGINWASGVVP
jgi:cytochrome c